MAHRFVLEVPEDLAHEVNTVIGTVPDAQVLVMRNSHGLGFNDPYMDLSVAAHSLAVIERIYEWMAGYGEPYPEVRLVMHDGRRVSFAKANLSLMVAAVRRDQPWIDHSMPQIGVHEPKPWLAKGALATQADTSPLVLNDPQALRERFESATTVAVQNLAPAEQYYEEVLDLHVAARAWMNEQGEFRLIEGEYDPRIARLKATEADVVFLENGPLKLNLQRFTRGVPLPYGTDPREIHTTATQEQMSTIKGRVLIYGSDLLEGNDDVLRFVDPFNVVWTITPAVPVDAGTPAALQG